MNYTPTAEQEEEIREAGNHLIMSSRMLNKSEWERELDAPYETLQFVFRLGYISAKTKTGEWK